MFYFDELFVVFLFLSFLVKTRQIVILFTFFTHVFIIMIQIHEKYLLIFPISVIFHKLSHIFSVRKKESLIRKKKSFA